MGFCGGFVGVFGCFLFCQGDVLLAFLVLKKKKKLFFKELVLIVNGIFFFSVQIWQNNR